MRSTWLLAKALRLIVVSALAGSILVVYALTPLKLCMLPDAHLGLEASL